MELMNKIEHDLKNAMREKAKFRLNVLRSLKSAVKYEAIESKEELSDETVLKILKKQVKSRQQAIELYQQGDREDLAAKEKAEIEIILEYLPTPLSEQEVAAAVSKTIAELEATSMKDMGKVMGSLKASLGGRADGKLLSSLVRKQLS
ncbi:MAG: GatB/YqeY domain-containing protein [Candidatus Cloacimonadales bacterium]